MPEDRDAALYRSIDQAALQIASEMEGAVSDHPKVEDLVGYQEDRLANDDAERIRRHVVACPECARELLELEGLDFESRSDRSLLPNSAETAEDWAEFQQRVAANWPQPTPRNIRPPWWALAAAVAVAAVFGFWLGLNHRSSIPPAPTNLADIQPLGLDLLPDGEALSREVTTENVQIPGGVDALFLRLHLGDQTIYETYSIAVVNADGVTIWSQQGLLRQPEGGFVLLMPRTAVSSGRYQLQLIGTTDGEVTTLATYTFMLSNASL